ncbi:hypothetical protein N7451_010921 [Penicillium sp. IBT 35674x]|nr:hypothetical protein N7451_010921 [Penicillium sp. IBT 35674x]
MYSNTQTSIRGPSSLSLVSPARSTTHTIVVLTKTETVTNCNTLITQRSTSSTARKTTVPTSSSDAGRLTMPVWLVMISMAILLFLL